VRDEEYIELFHKYDDPVYWEYPPGMDYKKQVARLRQFVSELEQRLCKKLEIETESHIQDASFHSQVLLNGANLRFSNFGDMVATTDDESIALDTLGNVKELLVKHGYVFVPHALLEQDYTGKNPGVMGKTVDEGDGMIGYFVLGDSHTNSYALTVTITLLQEIKRWNALLSSSMPPES